MVYLTLNLFKPEEPLKKKKKFRSQEPFNYWWPMVKMSLVLVVSRKNVTLTVVARISPLQTAYKIIGLVLLALQVLKPRRHHQMRGQ